ncbi:hypothetical protein, partial [Brevibacillus sp. FIR094]|uniref:hypothetical protein n=1 Tax=Brevibacillus sp. FIR094 TaxID=3134809 RepID=UPI003D24E9F6
HTGCLGFFSSVRLTGVRPAPGLFCIHHSAIYYKIIQMLNLQNGLYMVNISVVYNYDNLCN